MKSRILLTALAMAALTQGCYVPPKDKTYRPKHSTSGRYNLPLWDFEGQPVYARNEKEAIKRAKKRGYWREGMSYKQIG